MSGSTDNADSINSADDSCPFCDLSDRIVIESQLWVGIEDAFPVNVGHSLLIPRRHFASFRDITSEEFIDLYSIMQVAIKRFDNMYQPTGYNFGVNDGAVAGQTVFHVHFHIIPRYSGDTENPRGGVRKVKTSLKPYNL
ncbi:MAG: HIT family protein [Acidobacteriota bacterium]